MFGYVQANLNDLSDEEKKQIKADCNDLRKLPAKAKPEKMTADPLRTDRQALFACVPGNCE